MRLSRQFQFLEDIYITVKKQFDAKQVTIKATFEYNDVTSTKTFTLNVPALTEFEHKGYYTTSTITLDPSTKTGTYTYKVRLDSNENEGHKFTYTLDEEKKEMTITATAEYDEKADKWIPVNELSAQAELAMLSIPNETIFSYEVKYTGDYPTGAWFDKFVAVYDSSKPRYKQYGEYKDGGGSRIVQNAVKLQEGVIKFSGTDYSIDSWESDFSRFV